MPHVYIATRQTYLWGAVLVVMQVYRQPYTMPHIYIATKQTHLWGAVLVVILVSLLKLIHSFNNLILASV